MKIQSQNQTSFGAKYPFTTPSQKFGYIGYLRSKGILNYKINEEDKVILTGKDITEYAKNQIAKHKKSPAKFEQSVAAEIAEFKNANRKQQVTE